MRDRVVRKVANFVLKLASKSFQNTLNAVIRAGMVVLGDEDLSRQVLDKLKA